MKDELSKQSDAKLQSVLNLNYGIKGDQKLECLTCGHISSAIVDDNWFEVQFEGKSSLQSILKTCFVAPEIVDNNCKKCNQTRKQKKSTQFTRLPPTLNMHVGRIYTIWNSAKQECLPYKKTDDVLIPLVISVEFFSKKCTDTRRLFTINSFGLHSRYVNWTIT
jgi:uncharacterized UBP type Zn finger protein